MKIKYSYLIIILGISLFIPFLGSVHLFDWDEINFAEFAREMIETGDYFSVQINFERFWEKPPFFFWLQVLSMKLFGITEFAARLPNAIFGIITLLTIFSIGKRLKSRHFGFLWAMVFLGSFLPFLYFKSGIIDPIFNYFIFISIYSLVRAKSSKNQRIKNKFMLLSGVAIGFSIITKGPVGLLLWILTLGAYALTNRFKIALNLKQLCYFSISCLFITFLWYLPETINNGFDFLIGFIEYQIDLFLRPGAGHQQPIYYHFVVVLVGCFPMSVFALGSFGKSLPKDSFRLWMKCLFWVVMILFTVVSTKIVHYSSMCYLPLSYLASDYLYKLSKKQKTIPLWINIVFLIIGSILSLLVMALPFVAYYKERVIPYIDDEFAVQSLLNTDVQWGGYEYLIGLCYLGVIIIVFLSLFKTNIRRTVIILSICSASFLSVILWIIVPKVEGYSQKPAIDFYKSLQGKDVYVTTYKFYSYAQYFYFRQPNDGNSKRKDNQWLLTGDIDKPVYFVAKCIDTDFLDSAEDILKLGNKGGFVFYVRYPKQ